jgi:hypothetical protein
MTRPSADPGRFRRTSIARPEAGDGGRRRRFDEVWALTVPSESAHTSSSSSPGVDVRFSTSPFLTTSAGRPYGRAVAAVEVAGR